MSCPYRSTAGQGSGYTKVENTAAVRQAETALQRLMQERAAQEAKWFSAYTAQPVEPKPPSPRIVEALGNLSTTTTRPQGSKLGDAS
jgi:hypothetical protein